MPPKLPLICGCWPPTTKEKKLSPPPKMPRCRCCTVLRKCRNSVPRHRQCGRWNAVPRICTNWLSPRRCRAERIAPTDSFVKSKINIKTPLALPRCSDTHSGKAKGVSVLIYQGQPRITCSSKQTAWAAMPSPLPVKPNPSSVVALTLTAP